MVGCSGLTVTVCCAWVSVVLMMLLEVVEVTQLLAVQTCRVASRSCPQNVLSCAWSRGPEKLGESLSPSLGIPLWSQAPCRFRADAHPALVTATVPKGPVSV